MTKGTRAFRIIISILLGLTMLWTAFISYAFLYYVDNKLEQKQAERYGIYVAGVDVTRGNAHDILGDGTVSYNEVRNRLTFCNATIECEGSAIYSEIDLTVELVGENKFVCSGKEYTYAVYTSDVSLKKDLAITGNGSLEIIIADDTCENNAGIIAGELWIGADVSITLANAADSSDGISCSYLNLDENTVLTVKTGSAEQSSGIFVRGNMHLEDHSVLHVTGSASEKESRGIEVTGTVTAEEAAQITASCGGTRAGIVCYDVFLDYGANVNSGIDAIDGIRYMAGSSQKSPEA